jgi:hypothetical protein
MDAVGTRLASVANFVTLQYVLRSDPGMVGVLELTVPPSFDLSRFKVDGRIAPYRSIGGREAVHDNGAVYLIRKLTINPDDTATATAYHATSLLARRHILYFAGTAYAAKSAAPADDQIKAFVRENMGSLVNTTDRRVNDTQANVSSYLSIQADVSRGPSIAKAAAWRNLLEVCAEIAEASATAGTYLTFEVIAPTESTLELRTSVDARGIDRRAGTGQDVVFSLERGNVENVVVEEDHIDEITFAAAGGQGEGAARLTRQQLDLTRIAESPFGRIETWLDMANVNEGAALQDDADAALSQGRRVITMTADLVETPATTRGLHFDLGDLVTVERRGRQHDCRIDLVTVEVQGGAQRSKVALRSIT